VEMARRQSRGDTGSKSLDTYRRKRDFTRTPEPAGDQATFADPTVGPRFVVQRHRARRLHYDFRLEIDGVLVSWAVPKGPTLDPDVRRAAFHVEDHPIEYIDFEGVIPSGEYGGGDVIVWDAGTWSIHVSGRKPSQPRRAVASGEIHVDLNGQKLQGRFVLTRTGPASTDKEDWLLLHKHDEYAVTGWDPEEHPLSVLSGRTNEQVKADPDRLWRSDAPAESASVRLKPSARQVSDDELDQLEGLGSSGTWSVFDRELKVTNLDKELFPASDDEASVTKRELLRYAAQIAPTMTPYLAGRALNMHRFPHGAQARGFWHKQLPAHAPAWLPRWDNPEADEGESQTYLVVDEPAALVWAANFGALEWHPWTSRVDAPRKPTYALIDLDPGPSTSWEDVLVLARLHRTALEHLGVRARPKLTGRRGI
jgi:bifunctional non-homologous end joining protein LigD